MECTVQARSSPPAYVKREKKERVVKLVTIYGEPSRLNLVFFFFRNVISGAFSFVTLIGTRVNEQTNSTNIMLDEPVNKSIENHPTFRKTLFSPIQTL